MCRRDGPGGGCLYLNLRIMGNYKEAQLLYAKVYLAAIFYIEIPVNLSANHFLEIYYIGHSINILAPSSPVCVT